MNRPLGRRVAAGLHLWGVTPNQATAISATLSAAALILVAAVRPSPLLGLLVAVLLAGGYVMDSVDGQLARLRGGGSLSGEMLDHTVDCVKTLCLHLAVLISLYRFTTLDPLWLLVPIGFQVVDMVIYFGVVTMPLLRKLHGATPDDSAVLGGSAASTSAAPATEHPLRRWLLLPTDYGIFCWMFVLLGWPMFFLTAYSAMFVANAAVSIVVVQRWGRELRAMDGG
ncbi:MAG TPA: CDP-alcohol phosphatidyltransferase family protein [Microlunatus sp.]|nr:CDP-alcohol phosphatidyltransferase family protein [Microlunatus sp.]